MDESWDEAPGTSGEIANLLVTSTDDEMRMDWLAGVTEAYAEATAKGMKPTNAQEWWTSTCGQTSITILPAKVFRIRKANTLSKGEPSGWTEYYRPIKLPEARKESIYLHVQYYTKIKGTTNRFELSVNDPGVFHAAAIVCPLSMTYTRGSKGQHVYQITEEAEDVMRQAAKGAKEWVEVVPSKINAKRQRDEKQDKDHRHHVYAVRGKSRRETRKFGCISKPNQVRKGFSTYSRT